MKFNAWIKKIMGKFEGYDFDGEFDIGIDKDMEVNPDSRNRIRFRIRK